VKIYCKYDELINPKKLKDHPKNRNKHGKDQIERLADLYRYHGIRHPIIISKRSGFIVAGHGRRNAAEVAGMDSFPVVYQEFDSEEAEYAFIQADNAIALWAELDLAGINTDLADLGPDFDVDWLGIKDFVLDPAEKIGLVDEDEVPEHVEPKSKLGDIYKMGDHRLMCGDSTSIDAVEKLMAGGNAEITFTSPPYNAAKFEVTGTARRGKSEVRSEKYLNNSDDMSEEQYEQFISDIVAMYSSKSESVMLNIGILEPNKRAVFRVLAKYIELFKDTIYWRKSTSTPHIQPGIMTSVVEPIFCFGKHNSRQFKTASFRGNFSNIIEGSNASGNEYAKIHAATFPSYLPETIINNFTSSGGAVIDCFGGTGTTLIACEKTNRKCFMMELDPHYCDVIVARWEKYTGKTAELLNADL
jgi:site-specific DNA-methyltransferase (adenine-specific)